MKDDNLVKQDICVWVKASDESPEQNSLTIRYRGSVQFVSYEYTGSEFICDSDNGVIINDIANVEWLKPLSQVYVLTVEELDDLQNEWYGIGANAALH